MVACYLQVIHRLGAEAPKKSLVENYMIEIARNYKVDYEPDPTMFMVSQWTQPLPVGAAIASGRGHCVVSLIARCCFPLQQEDEGFPAVDKGFLPDGEEAGPLPPKEDPDRYQPLPVPRAPPQSHFPAPMPSAHPGPGVGFLHASVFIVHA